jgi:aminomethyltransferase
MSDSLLKKTALNTWHKEHGARMVPFAGWEMPVQYSTGPLEEHIATRERAGLFDIDHMGQIRVTGPDAERFVNYLITYDVTRMKTFQAHYSALCYADGGTVDDLFVYKLPPRDGTSIADFFLVVNASNLEKDVRWLKSHRYDYDVTIEDFSPGTYMLALQGPAAERILDTVADVDTSAIPRFTAAEAKLFGKVETLLGRTGYTGEDGFELFFAEAEAEAVWRGLLEAGAADGILPIGLAARDSLRFEPCMPLYGQELDAYHSPIAAGLSFAVSANKEFIGRDYLLKQQLEGSDEQLCGFEMIDRGVPRHGYPVRYRGLDVGQVSSGMMSPTTKRYVGMAFLPAEIASVGTQLEIVIHGKAKAAEVVKMPFYVPAYRR